MYFIPHGVAAGHDVHTRQRAAHARQPEELELRGQQSLDIAGDRLRPVRVASSGRGRIERVRPLQKYVVHWTDNNDVCEKTEGGRRDEGGGKEGRREEGGGRREEGGGRRREEGGGRREEGGGTREEGRGRREEGGGRREEGGGEEEGGRRKEEGGRREEGGGRREEGGGRRKEEG